VAEGVDYEGQSEHDPLFGLRHSACEKTKIPAQPEHRHGWCSGGNIVTRGHGRDNLDHKPMRAGQPLQIPRWRSYGAGDSVVPLFHHGIAPMGEYLSVTSLEPKTTLYRIDTR